MELLLAFVALPLAMSVQDEQRLKGPTGATMLELTLEAERLPVHLRPDAWRVFLLPAGKPIRVEPDGPIGIPRKLLADKSVRKA